MPGGADREQSHTLAADVVRLETVGISEVDANEPKFVGEQRRKLLLGHQRGLLDGHLRGGELPAGLSIETGCGSICLRAVCAALVTIRVRDHSHCGLALGPHSTIHAWVQMRRRIDC